MGTNFPISFDSYLTLTDNTDDVLASHMNDRGDAIEALETKVGIDSSVVNTSFDYFLKHASGAYRTHTHNGTSDDGSATLSPTTINAFTLNGKLTAGANEIEGSNFDINGGTIDGITDLAIVDGGTGASTAQAAINALAGAVTSNRVLRADGANISLAQVVLTSDVSGTLPLANGGTGQNMTGFAMGAKAVAYNGNSSDNRTVAHGLGRTPIYVLISRISGGEPIFWISGFTAGSSMAFNGSPSTNYIKGVDATNITLGTDGLVNGTGAAYNMIVM